MKLIVGLGNPGKQYAATRHNAGFHTVERIAAAQGWAWEKRGNARLAPGVLNGEKILLAEPLTYMNLSGTAVQPIVHFFKLPLSDLLIICDDLDLPVGRVRVREKGGSGGQHGMANIIEHLGSDQFARLRIGIGRPPHPRSNILDWVLGIPSAEDRALIEDAEARAAEASLVWAFEGPRVAMDRYNAEPKPPKAEPSASSGTEAKRPELPNAE